MEDNEQNQHLALQVLSLVSQGCLIQLPDLAPLLFTVGYAEMWLDRDMFFYCEINGGQTGKQHVVEFDHFSPLSNQVLFYDKRNRLMATLAPYVEWPDVNTDEMNQVWAEWNKNKEALRSCQEAGREWRHAEL